MLRDLVEIERLGPTPTEQSPTRDRARLRTVLRDLFAIEDLGPEPPPEIPRRRAPARAFLAREPLPYDAPAAPRRRTRWLAWLFAVESLDPP